MRTLQAPIVTAARERIRAGIRANLTRLRERGMTHEARMQEAALSQLEDYWHEQDRAERWAREAANA